MQNWIQTFRGRQFRPLDPIPGTIDIFDIAHALSNLCRWGGHVKEFYSVAQHSIVVGEIIREQGGSRSAQFAGLMHDASEAYLLDIPTPVKAQIPGYGEAEKRLQGLIETVFHIQNFSAAVRKADGIALATEARDFMGGIPGWRTTHKPLEVHIQPWTPGQAEREFLERYNSLSV